MSNYFAAISASFRPVLARRTGATRIQETDTTRLGSENCRHRAATNSAVSWLVTFEIVPASVSDVNGWQERTPAAPDAAQRPLHWRPDAVATRRDAVYATALLPPSGSANCRRPRGRCAAAAALCRDVAPRLQRVDRLSRSRTFMRSSVRLQKRLAFASVHGTPKPLCRSSRHDSQT
jgi:hypothetical protein